MWRTRSSSPPPARRTHRDERGSILLAVLGVTLLTTSIAIAVGYRTAIAVRAANRLADAVAASSHARAGLEAALHLVGDEPGWRTDRGEGVWIDTDALGSRITVSARDAVDGSIAVDPAILSTDADPVRLRARVRRGEVIRTVEADGIPQPHPALACAAVGVSEVRLLGGRVEGRVWSAGTILHDGVTELVGDVLASPGELVAATLADDDTAILRVSDPATLPGPDLGFFRDAGEEIPLPASRILSGVVFSSTSNPLGAISPHGLYWIDADGGDVILTEVCVLGTLAVLDATEVRVEDPYATGLDRGTAYEHRAVNPALPALLVEGDLRLSLSGERVAMVTGDDGMRRVTSAISGVVLATGRLRGPQVDTVGEVFLHGSIIADRLELVSDEARLRHDPTLDANPVAGFVIATLRPVAGSTREVKG